MGKSAKSSKEPMSIKLIRILLGLVFIFSSAMKGIDPMGTAYRVEDYLEAYNLLFLFDYAFWLGIFLIAVEFLLGISMLLKLHAKLGAVGVLLIMIFFTSITYIDAKFDMVPDCGCFGDAIKLTAWQTFYKNVVIDVLIIIVFFKFKSLQSKLASWLQTSVIVLFMSAFIYFIYYNYNHLPIIDFVDWKVGRDMKSDENGNAKTYVIYMNKMTGEQKEYLSSDYPWNDSVWMSEWEFVDQRTDESGFVRKHNLVIEDYEGNNMTRSIVENPGFQVILISYDIETANGEAMLQASKLSELCSDESVSFVMLSSSGQEIIQTYEQVYQINYPTFLADDTELKAMIRSNPGIIVLRDGVVIKKWHFNDFPDTLNKLIVKEKN